MKIPRRDLETDRLHLVMLSRTHYDAVIEYHQRNRAFWKPWTPIMPESAVNRRGMRRLDRLSQEDLRLGRAFRFFMVPKAQPGVIIGDFSISAIIRGSFLSSFLGYKADEAWTGKGYMTEALHAVLAFSFHEAKLHRVEANVMPRNTASIGLVRRCGFNEEGLALRYLRINNVWEDHIHFARRNEVNEARS